MKTTAAATAKKLLILTRRGFSYSSKVRGDQHQRIPTLGDVSVYDLKRASLLQRQEEKDKKDKRHQATTTTTTTEGKTSVPAKANRLVKAFLFGSEESKREQEQLEKSFSTKLSRGKYVHELTIHNVKPDKVHEYLDIVSNLMPKIASNPDNNVNLVGIWRVAVGENLDSFIHIWEYKGFSGYHTSLNQINKSNDGIKLNELLSSTLTSRNTNIMQEFSFWGGTASPHSLGGIFELRKYELVPGKLLDWETSWRQGLEYRRKVMFPVGAWFSQIGHLNTVYHLWQFTDLEHRRISRQKCWELPGWSDTVHETVQMIYRMDSSILVPLSFSPLR